VNRVVKPENTSTGANIDVAEQALGAIAKFDLARLVAITDWKSWGGGSSRLRPARSRGDRLERLL
jgi:hypothetical protein